MISKLALRFSLCALCVLCGESSSPANPPTVSYIFPAGGQRGTAVPVRVGGLFLHDKCEFDLTSPGVTATPHLVREKPVWFEGPILPLPESQAQEDYPADMRGTVTLAKDAKVGPVRGRVFTSQGGAGGLVFVVGELPEVVEKEIDGEAIPERITLPVTANGRIFPREDIDLWEFDAEAGKTITAFAHAPSLNSPLVPQLDIFDEAGKMVASQMTHPCARTDASVKFTPKVAGKYRVRITDARTLGGSAYVYRLTVTTADVPDSHFPLKIKPDGLKDVTEPRETVTAPIAINGRVAKAGDVNEYALDLKKDHRYTLDLHAKRAESPLCGVVTVLDAAGKELARAESADPANDPAPLAFTASTDGIFTVRVSEKFRGRGGPNFAYRLRVLDGTVSADTPGFRLTLLSDVATMPRAGNVKVKVGIERMGGFTGPVIVTAVDLPKGVTANPLTIAANQPGGDLTLIATADAAIATHSLRLTGFGVGGLHTFPRGAAVVTGTRFLPESTDAKLTIAFPTPFKIIDQYVMTSAPRGETYYRKYKIDRAGFDGVIQVQLADKQARHLQGVTGPVLTLKAGETEFAYPAFLPPWMELGRTCRACVMATAKVKDADGREHAVSFSSTEQNQQMIVVVAPGRLDLSCEKTSILAVPGGEVRVSVKVSRSKSLTGAAKVEAVLPDHWKGVTVAPLLIALGSETGELVLKFAPDCGPFNAPLVLRATVETKETSVTAETKLEVVK